ncbi:hypothetical protein Nepgr_028593 [Nepenthes gracilis]|uniref:PPM-type phosphatase domain-containing protein n=1 Tax=Nepenthes gracilis TaxID=150966 RepID=A0AAD3TAM4_NEPGR|nr:hypothetical protein Nepgr_028593 [Nepenthes gracilis]
MGSGFSQLISCFKPEEGGDEPEVVFTATEPLDKTLGHSFCYVRSSARFLSPTHSDRFLSPTCSLRFSPTHERSDPTKACETAFRTISGASVSANTSTPTTVLQFESICDDGTYPADAAAGGGMRGGSIVNGFESTSLFSALPLQPVPRGEPSGPIERGGFFLSGPIERGALSGPLDSSTACDNGRVPFSAPLGGLYVKRKKRKKSLSSIKKALSRSLSEKQRPWVVPVRNFAGRKEVSIGGAVSGGAEVLKGESESAVQWALGKAGEDRVHVVVSEEHGWLFIGIYDGFNGPDAPEFLMGHLYRAVHHELKGLFWDNEDRNNSNSTIEGQINVDSALESAVVLEKQNLSISSEEILKDGEIRFERNQESLAHEDHASAKRVTFQSEQKEIRKKLWEYLAEDDTEDGLDLSGSDRFAFTVDDAVSIGNSVSAVSRRSLLLSKLKQGFSRNKDGHIRKLFLWRFGAEENEKTETENTVEERAPRSSRRRKTGPVDHGLVLRAMSSALEKTELAYLDLTDKVIDRYPELALMGSCLLVALMRNEDVYVMNVGDSRAIVAQLETQEASSNAESKDKGDNGFIVEAIIEESTIRGERSTSVANEVPSQAKELTALQLSRDHSTSIEEEVLRIKSEHSDDSHCIVNDRVKGRLKVTRAFGAGFLKQPKWNDSLLEMFRNEFIGNAPYISCTPSVCHYKLCPKDQFLVLSSDGLYQYLSNEEVVSHVADFMDKFPDGDPAQHLIEELLSRAAKKAGMDFHDLLDIPQGDRRKYHDDVTVMVVSLEGRIWKSSGKYP